jgi:hypothetical protein
VEVVAVAEAGRIEVVETEAETEAEAAPVVAGSEAEEGK